MGRAGTASPGWTFLSNHGHVLVALATDPDLRMREVADLVGITERSVQLIVRDLEQAGYVERERVGRRNHYTVVPSTTLRHELEAHVRVADLLGLVTDRPSSAQRRPLGRPSPD